MLLCSSAKVGSGGRDATPCGDVVPAAKQLFLLKRVRQTSSFIVPLIEILAWRHDAGPSLV